MKRIRSKKWVCYVAVLTLLLLAGERTDIGRLRPVEVVSLCENDGVLLLETDSGEKGWGLTVEQAVEKMKETTAGVVYLDTADYLLIEKGLEYCLPSLRNYLKKKTAMVYGAKDIQLSKAAEFLGNHRPSRTIGRWDRPAEKLMYENGKIIYTREYYYGAEYDTNSKYEVGSDELKYETFNVLDKDTLQNTYYEQITELKKQ